MRKLIYIIAFFLFLFVTMQSCSKNVDESEIIMKVTIDTTIKAGTEYELSLISYGDDDDDIATIIQQAAHSSISQLENLSDVFNPVYHYASSEKTTGTDRVVLAISKNPDIRKCNRDSTIITINFTIQ